MPRLCGKYTGGLPNHRRRSKIEKTAKKGGDKMKKRILCALIGLLILIASSAMAEGPKWMTIRNLNWVVIDDYHITIPDGMKTAGLNT